MDWLAKARALVTSHGGWLPSEVAKELRAAAAVTEHELLRRLIPLASEYALPAQSGFSVGAVGLGRSGAIYLGANIEFPESTLSHTVHAEQAVVVNAACHDEESLVAMAISAPPCGYCRQFLSELVDSEKLEILLSPDQTTTLASLLPEAFGPAELGVESRLLKTTVPSLTLVDNADAKEELRTLAFKAARKSYAPYTNSHGAAAMRMVDGNMVAAPHLENAAFNPTINPVQGSMVMARLSGYSFEDVRELHIIQTNDTKVDHFQTAKSLLRPIAPSVDIGLSHCRQADGE